MKMFDPVPIISWILSPFLVNTSFTLIQIPLYHPYIQLPLLLLQFSFVERDRQTDRERQPKSILTSAQNSLHILTFLNLSFLTIYCCPKAHSRETHIIEVICLYVP